MASENAHAAKKACVSCGHEKPMDAFHNDSRRKDGKYPYCKACRVARSSDYHRKNADRIRKYVAEWQALNPEKRAKQNKAYARRHPEALRMKQARRRARKRDNGVFDVSKKDMMRLKASPCAECGAAGEHIDHIVPLSRGGRHAIGNLQMLCASCNWSKNSQLTIEWRAKRLVAA